MIICTVLGKKKMCIRDRYYEVVGVAKDTGVLNEVAVREGIRVIDAPLERPISIGKDIKALWFLWRLFRRGKPWCVHANTPKGSLLAMVAAWAARVPNRIYLVTGLRYQATTGMLRTILKAMERVTCCCSCLLYTSLRKQIQIIGVVNFYAQANNYK